MVTNETVTPYDRTVLSKGVATADASKLGLRSDTFLKEADIDMKFKRGVTQIDTQAKRIHLHGGEEFSYDKVLLATGSVPRKPTVPGSDLKGIHVLRTANHQEAIKAEAKDAQNIVVLGGSWIATECASGFATSMKEKKTSMIYSSSVPFEKTVGKEIGQMWADEHAKAGVNLVSNA